MENENRYLPYSGRRYIVSQYGTVARADGELVVSRKTSEGIAVKLDWIFGSKFYNVGLVVLVSFKTLTLPDHLWDRIEVLYMDGDSNNCMPTNLTYRFKDGPLEVQEYPGYFFVPFFTTYAIDVNGNLINVNTGRTLTWWVTKPNGTRNSTGGYSCCRVVTGVAGESKMLFRHRALCLTFKPYGGDVADRVVNHIDGAPSNDTLDNLEWSTYSDNNKHAYSLGLRPNASRAVLMKNLKDGTILRFESISACARYLGNDYGTMIRLRILNSSDKLFDDMLTFKFDDETPWPYIDVNTKPTRCGGGGDIVARNVFTGEKIIFTGSNAGEKLTGVYSGTIIAHVNSMLDIPVMGYNFRYLSDVKFGWPNHTKRHLDIYRKHPLKAPNGVIKTDVTTGEETLFTSIREASSMTGISVGRIIDYINRDVCYLGKFKFSYFFLKKTLGPPLE